MMTSDAPDFKPSRNPYYHGSVMIFRAYNPETDEKAAIRIRRECGWSDMKKNRRMRDAFRRLTAEGTADVCEHQGSVESLVTTSGGTIRMLDTDLPFRAVTGVTTGRTLRRMGGAAELTARAVMNGALSGDAAAGLGIFDQGFYDKLGFANFPYSRILAFDPLSLDVPPLTRPPLRLTRRHIPRIVACTLERKPCHGLVKIPSEAFTDIMMTEVENGFCLGFENNQGCLTHYFFAEANGENGPYEILSFVYRDYEGLIELLSLIKNLGDQVNTFKMLEPPGIQLQDLLTRPFRSREVTQGSKFRNEMRAVSYRQARILNLKRVLAALKLPAGHLRFNLELKDPIAAHLPEEAEWKGLGGPWTVELEDGGSSAAAGRTDGLPVLTASVGAFTRLIFGAVGAEALSVTDELSGSEELLGELDRRLILPRPDMVQDF